LLSPQVVVVWPFPAVGRLSVHDRTPTLLVLWGVQVTVSQLFVPSPVWGVHDADPSGPVVRTGHVVVFQPLASVGEIGTQLPVGVFSTFTGVHTVVVKALTPVGYGSGTQVATGTSVVTTGGGQVIVAQPFEPAAVCATHTATGSFKLLLSAQVVVFHWLEPSPVAGLQVCTGTLAVLLLPQTVAVHELLPSAATPVQDAMPTAGVVMAAGQAVLVQLLPTVAGVTVQEATATGPITSGVGQVVVVQLFPRVGPEGAHDRTGTSSRSFVPQTISTQAFDALAVCGVHEGTGTVARAVLQVVPTQPFARLGGSGTQVPACTGVDVVTVLQSVRLYPLARVAGSAVQDATTVGPLNSVSGGQVVVTKSFASVGDVGVHEATATLVVLFVPQVVLVWPFAEVGPEIAHDATGTLVVSFWLQVVTV
jgi:putative effector of murein hydrolase LrgA (UPF0299 family)